MGNCTSFTFHQWAVDLGQIHLHCSLLTSFFKDTGRPPVKHLTFLCLSLLNYEIGVLTSVQTLLWDSIKIIDLNPPVRINVSQFSQRTGGTDYFLSVVWFFILPSYLLSDISLRLSIPSPYILSTVLCMIFNSVFFFFNKRWVTSLYQILCSCKTFLFLGASPCIFPSCFRVGVQLERRLIKVKSVVSYMDGIFLKK